MRARFHAGVADACARAVILAREHTGSSDVCLGGGVFHHRLPAKDSLLWTARGGMEVYLPVRVSPGDEGLSYGRAAVAAAFVATGKRFNGQRRI